MRDALRRVPAVGWLAAIVVGSAALRLWLTGGMPGPFIFVDELIYAELARSLADGGGYAIREVGTSGYSLLYPLLIAPAYALDNLVDAHRAAQSINAVVMSLAAIPAFALARRASTDGLALLVAGGSVLVPSMAYTGTITTESLFYPVSLCVALVLVRYLERPSRGRLAVLLGAVAVAFATRSQGLAFVPAILTAPLLLALLRGRAGELRRALPLYGVVGGAALALVLAQAVRGRSLADLLGTYSIVGESGYDVGGVLRYWLWHVEELTLYVAIVPVAALVVLTARARRLGPRVQEHLAVTLAFGLWSTLVVGAFASRFASDRVQDRYLFFLTPLLLTCLAAWVASGAPRPRVVAALGAAGALVLTLVFPYGRFIGEPAKSDSLGLVPLWAAGEHLVAGRAWLTVGVVGLVLVALFLLVPPRAAAIVPLAVVALLVVSSRPVWTSQQGFRIASAGAVFQGIRSVERDWIDAAVPDGEEVVALWTGHADRFTINQNEFFSRAVGRVLYTEEPTPGGLAETHVSTGPGGVYRDDAGETIRAPYALLDQTVVPDGEVVARDEPLGITLWRLTGPLANTTTVTGLYPNDTWSGPSVTWTRVRCRPGVLRADLFSDPNLFDRRQVVRATTDGSTAAVAFPPTQTATLRVPVAPDSSGRCVVRFDVAPTAVPSEVDPASGDDRELGAHFVLSFTPSP